MSFIGRNSCRQSERVVVAEHWCVAQLDEAYIERMEDVLKRYEKPLSARAPVVCLDEKPVVLHADTRPSVPMSPGHAARRDYEYKRCGTANVFCAVEPKAGRHFTKVTPTRDFGNLSWPTSAVCFGPPCGLLMLRVLGSAGA